MTTDLPGANEIRVRKSRDAWRQHGWSSVPNHLLLRADISWQAKGAFGWLSLAADDPEFDVTAQALANAGPDGRDKAKAVLRELEQHGYLTRVHEVNAESGLPETVYDLWPVPVPEDERTYVPSTAKRRRRPFSQRNPGKLDGQSSGGAQANVDNSASPESVKPDFTKPRRSGGTVFPAQSRKTGWSVIRPLEVPRMTGRSVIRPSSPERITSSSFPPPPTEASTQMQEEEDETDEPQKPDTASLLAEHARFRPGRYLTRAARAECERLLSAHRDAGWSDERLARWLRDWSAAALNPSTYLVNQLSNLAAPPAPVRRDQASSVAGRAPEARREPHAPSAQLWSRLNAQGLRFMPSRFRDGA